MLLLLACAGSGEGASGGGVAADYVPGEGMIFQYALEGAKQALYDTGAAAETGAGGETGAPDPSASLSLEVTAKTWELTAATTASFSWALGEDGLLVSGSRLLPSRLAVGTQADGVEVLETGEDTVWYGTFDPTVRTAVAGGDFAGEATFAEGVGPIRLAWGGSRWELVYYERP